VWGVGTDEGKDHECENAESSDIGLGFRVVTDEGKDHECENAESSDIGNRTEREDECVDDKTHALVALHQSDRGLGFGVRV